MSEAEHHILEHQRGALGIITLNRPKALNSLTLGMIQDLHPLLTRWASAGDVGAVLIQGAGEKAFCAGGDVVAVYRSGQESAAEGGEPTVAQDFFRAEYRLNYAIHTYAKPYVALIDGICMGGGAGLSIHGDFVVTGEKTLFAMPETGIGLFPDIGAGWFLNRTPGQLGVYLGLTGHRLEAADLHALGLATHHIPADGQAQLTQDLSALAADAGRDAVQAVLDRHHVPPGASPLAARLQAIDHCFDRERVEDIITALDQRQEGWSDDVAQGLRRLSPTSLKVTLRHLRAARRMTIEAVFVQDYRLARACLRHHDFYEGVRALLVDKDKSPQWSPSRLAAVDDALVDDHFQAPPDGDWTPAGA